MLRCFAEFCNQCYHQVFPALFGRGFTVPSIPTRFSRESPSVLDIYIWMRTGLAISARVTSDISYIPLLFRKAPRRFLRSSSRKEKARSRCEVRCEHDVGTEYRGSSRRGPFRNDTARVINNVCFNVNLRRGSNLISTEATRSNADGDWLGGIAGRSLLRNVEVKHREERRERKKSGPLKGRRRRREEGRRGENPRRRGREGREGARRREEGGGRRRRRAARHCSRPLARDS